MSYAVTPFTHNFGTVNTMDLALVAVVVPGAAEFGWAAIGWELAAPPSIMAQNLIVQCAVTNTNEVTVYIHNLTAGNVVVGTLSGVIRLTMEGG